MRILIIFFTDVIKDFLMFQDETTENDSSYDFSSSFDQPILNATKLDYRNTAFIIEILLIDREEDKK